MFAARILAVLAFSPWLVCGAEMHGTWSASTARGPLAGIWTAETQQSAAVTGTWILQDATGAILMRGGWSAAKSAQSWEGAWRATISTGAGEYSGTWTGATSLPPSANLAAMFESAVKAAVSGTWKSGSYAGSWSIRASP